MKMRNYLFIIANPKSNSISKQVLDVSISNIIKSKNKYDVIDLYDDNFNPSLTFSKKQLDSSLIELYQNKIKKADTIVIIYPIWWQSVPAIMKGFFDRVFTSGFAFRYSKLGIPIGLLKGKTGVIICSFGGPWLLSKLYGNGSLRAVKKGLLNFCGIKSVKTYCLYGVDMKLFSERKINNFLDRISKIFL